MNTPTQNVPAWVARVAGAEKQNKSQPNFMGMDGTYTLDISEIKIVESQQGVAKSFFIVEFDVVETSHPQIRVGESRTWLCTLDSNSGVSDVQAFCLDVLAQKFGRDVTVAELADPAILLALTSAEQPLKGVRVALRTWTKPQKRDPSKSWTTHDWRGLDPDTVQGIETDHSSPHVQAYQAAPVAAQAAPPVMGAPAVAQAPAGVAAPPGMAPSLASLFGGV
jgi:hypothetical protein